MLYIFVVLISGGIISAINIIFLLDNINLAWWQVILFVYGFALVEFAIDGLLAFIVNKLPKKWFNPSLKIFKIHKWERRFYERLGIKKWKDKIPELGKLGNFSKSTLQDPTSVEYIQRFIVECVIGEVVHISGLIFGFIILFHPNNILNITLPIAIVNLLLNIPSILILRYNRPKLAVVLERNKRLEQRKKEKELQKVG